MAGFKFRNEHSDDVGIGVKNIDRTLLPRKRNDEFTIPGRDGTIVFGESNYEKRYIRLEIYVVNNLGCEVDRSNDDDWEYFRLKIREVANWLSGRGLLIFDDEPDKAYQAEVYDDISLKEWENYPVGTIPLTFECQPFAESVYYNQANMETTIAGAELNAPVIGTQPTGCIITIKNIGSSIIRNISVTRKGEV